MKKTYLWYLIPGIMAFLYIEQQVKNPTISEGKLVILASAGVGFVIGAALKFIFIYEYIFERKE